VHAFFFYYNVKAFHRCIGIYPAAPSLGIVRGISTVTQMSWHGKINFYCKDSLRTRTPVSKSHAVAVRIREVPCSLLFRNRITEFQYALVQASLEVFQLTLNLTIKNLTSAFS
jgi:hypothetical protein